MVKFECGVYWKCLLSHWSKKIGNSEGSSEELQQLNNQHSLHYFDENQNKWWKAKANAKLVKDGLKERLEVQLGEIANLYSTPSYAIDWSSEDWVYHFYMLAISL